MPMQQQYQSHVRDSCPNAPTSPITADALTCCLSVQPGLYQSFASETEFLESFFGQLGGEGGSYVLGDSAHGLQWHIYVADAEPAPVAVAAKPTYTLEVCMTELCSAKVRQTSLCTRLGAACGRSPALSVPDPVFCFSKGFLGH